MEQNNPLIKRQEIVTPIVNTNDLDTNNFKNLQPGDWVSFRYNEFVAVDEIHQIVKDRDTNDPILILRIFGDIHVDDVLESRREINFIKTDGKAQNNKGNKN